MGSKNKKSHEEEASPASYSTSPSSSSDSDLSCKRPHRGRKERGRSDGGSRRVKDRKREREEKRRKKRERRERERERKRRKLRGEDKKKKNKKKKRRYDESESESGSGLSRSDSDAERLQVGPELVVKKLLREFPAVGNDLKQLLQMIDDGQAVDVKGISERSLIKHLKNLFCSLNLRQNGDSVFLLPLNARPTLDVIGPLIQESIEPKEQKLDAAVVRKDVHSVQIDADSKQVTDESNVETVSRDDSSASGRRIIGPEMPSAELLAAAAKLTEAQAELREVELEEDTGLFIGPPPPAMVAEAEFANEAERFEEVSRIMEVGLDCPYDILGVNRNMSADNIKKRYWKLSLLVHPDKCSHPQSHEAFVLLNKAFKELQDPDKRNALDEKIKLEEEQKEFKAELQAMREAAKWRRSQGISMEGDDELLAEIEVKVAPKRDEWMTTLPPERKPGMTMHSTTFSNSSKEGRGDTSVWTDTPSDRAQKAKMNYLEAYNEASALASNEEEKRRSSDADLVDRYNKAKRSKTLAEKHQEEAANRSKKKSKQLKEQEDWEGKHPWKPWDREKDLVAGRQSIKFNADNMAEGLASRFSSGDFQRNFL